MKRSLEILAMALLMCGAALPPSAIAADTPSAKPAATVHLRDFAYRPLKVEIHTGDTVLFVNDDEDAHTVTSTDKKFDSGGLASHESWKKTFDREGTFAYFCVLHPYMKASIIVTAAKTDGAK